VLGAGQPPSGEDGDFPMADTTFDIVIHYTGDPSYQPIFDGAAERWEEIIIADLPDVSNSAYGYVDDLLIDASIIFIDGPGGILGLAGPDAFRSGSGLPFHGEMEIDSADVAQMFSNGTLYNVILHEMGHILGFGTLWDQFDLLTGYQYTGVNALAEYRLLTGNSSESYVPVENNGGPGTAGAHWEEDIFDAELMTGYIEDPGITMPLSRATIASLADLGYTVPPPLGDVLWQHIDGIVATGVGELGDAPDGFETQEIGDFDGDGDSDIPWRNDVGAVLTWELENGEFAAEHIQPNAPIAWQVAGTGDFDGDGDHEILWQHNEGAVTIWEMEGGNYEVNHNQPNVGTTWRIAGTGDFDGDNDADILWRHEEGAVTIWEMEDNAYMVNHNQPFASNFYQIAGTGDFDGDADDDILWRGEDGPVVTWEMEGGNYEVNHNQPSAPTTWEIEGTHDFDHDRDDDLLWRHDDGQVVTWEMQDGNYVANYNFGDVGDDWEIRGTGEFDLV
jgi:hypothetical protein